MKKTTLLLLACLLLCSHDMYLKFDRYFLPPHTEAQLQLYNGTFHESDNVIDRDRMLDVSLVGRGKQQRPDTAQWTEDGGVTLLSFTTGEPGTWVAGVSTRARSIEMAAADFNDYLEHDGVLDVLEARRQQGRLDEDAVERYSKHVKAIFQVGDTLTDDWQTRLGYPIEFVPLSNPYHLHEGEDLQLQLLWQGEPLSGQLVYANSVAGEHGHSHTHSSTDSSAHEHSHMHSDRSLRTDKQGILTLQAPSDGIWYLRTIHLVPSPSDSLTHESNWATVTFEIGHRHEHGHAGVPWYWYAAGGLVVLLGVGWFLGRS